MNINMLLVIMATGICLTFILLFPAIAALVIKACRWFWFFVIGSWGYDGPINNGWPEDTIVGVYAVIVVVVTAMFLAAIGGFVVFKMLKQGD